DRCIALFSVVLLMPFFLAFPISSFVNVVTLCSFTYSTALASFGLGLFLGKDRRYGASRRASLPAWAAAWKASQGFEGGSTPNQSASGIIPRVLRRPTTDGSRKPLTSAAPFSRRSRARRNSPHTSLLFVAMVDVGAKRTLLSCQETSASSGDSCQALPTFNSRGYRDGDGPATERPSAATSTPTKTVCSSGKRFPRTTFFAGRPRQPRSGRSRELAICSLYCSSRIVQGGEHFRFHT